MLNNIDFGEGYSADTGGLQVNFKDDGSLDVKNYHEQTTTTNNATEGKDSINVPLPLPTDNVEEQDYQPPIPRPSPPTAFFVTAELDNKKIQFVNQSLGNASYIFWDFGDAQTSTEFNPEYTYASVGTYEVRLTVANSGGFDIFTRFIEVSNPAPDVDFNEVVGGFTVYLTNTSTTQNWVWDFGDGTSSTDQNPNHTYTDVGTYIITLTSGALTLTKTVKIDVEISLSWILNSIDETGSRIEHSLDGSTGWTTVNTVGAGITTYGVTLANDGIDSSVLNYFRVYAFNTGGDSVNPTNTSSVVCS